MRRVSFIAAGLVLSLGASALAQTGPSDGYIGVFGDAAGTDCCIDLGATNGTGTLYVIAVTGGGSSEGISGAEFRIAIDPPDPTAFFIWTASAASNVSLGSPIDNGSSSAGNNIAFPECQTVNGLAGDHIILGTITAVNVMNEHRLVVKRHNAPTNPDLPCPLFTLCDAPAFTAICMTLADGDPKLEGQEPEAFVSLVNSVSCAGASCGFVATEETTWTAVKDLFR